MNDIEEIMVVALIEDSKRVRDVEMPREEACFTTQFQLSRLRDAGFVIVPIEPTDAMIGAGMWASENGCKFYEVYGRMIEVSQGGDV